MASTWTATNGADTLTRLPSDAWVYRRVDDDSIWTFNAPGKLLTVVQRNGWSTTYGYAGDQLASITNAFGRRLSLAYNGAGQLNSVTTPDGRAIAYTHDAAGRLSAVTYPDGRTRGFLYENASFPHALTAILDEAGARWGSFAYDSQGRAISSELAGGVDRYQVNYPAAGSATITDPLGTSRSYSYGTTLGKLAVLGGTLPSGTGEADAARRVQDANGLITSETDFKGAVTTTAWDVARRLPVSVIRAAGTPETQTVSTQWHPVFSLPALITESGRTTSLSYDATGNLLSQTITDTKSNQARTWRWTYTPQNLVATETASNGAVTSYTYDAAGNLARAVNALGHETLYSYNSANRVISTTAPNGQVTTYTWDARDRLTSQTVGGTQTTTLTYNPTGTLATLTLPTGLVLNYSYDAAHRLTGWSNNRGEAGSFTLDAMGNRTAEQIRNASGAIAWMSAASINQINRTASRTQGYGAPGTFGYDANGERVAITNGLNQSTRYGLDGLRRVTAITDAANATATLGYNALDAVTQAKDFKGVATAYARDAQGNATTEASADIGTRITQYDALGLPSRIVDAMGQATAITRDLLGRPTRLSFADGSVTTLGYDRVSTSRGYLSEISDASGTTQYSHDVFGRVTLKRQTLASGLAQQVSYAYGANGLLASITYPNGGVLGHVYDATGRLTQLNWNGAPLVANIAWNPMGQPTGWRWPFLTALGGASRSYDSAGRAKATEFSSYVYDGAGRISALAQFLWRPGDADPTHNTIASGNVVSYVGYDSVGRITGFNSADSQTSFSYDANGNRSASASTQGSLVSQRSYQIAPQSNRLLGFSQKAGATTTNVAYQHNANGDLTSDGLRSFSYNAEGRLSAVTVGATDASPTTRYAHNALGQRVFKTEPLYPPSQGDEANPSFMQSLIGFFTKLIWQPASDAEKLGFAYVYDEAGSLIAETGTGGANSTGSTQYIYLPTANGPMPIAVVINGEAYAVSSDHLNTPRRIVNQQGQVVWQWAYSAFGDNEPTIAKNRFADLSVTPNPGMTNIAAIEFNLGYWGMYRDKESGLAQNWNRYYDKRSGRYTQPDRIGLLGGWNRIGYAYQNPLSFTDFTGLAVELRCRPAEIAAGLVNHCWLKTDEKEAGMNEQPDCSRAGNDASGLPLQPVVVSDHRCDRPTIVTPLPEVDESCVNSELQIGKALGRFAPPFNSCQTFTQDVIQKCSPNTVNKPYIGYPRSGPRRSGS